MAATLENPTQVAKEKSQADREKDQCENKLGKKAQEKRAQRTKKTRKILALMTLHCTDGTSNSGPFSPPIFHCFSRSVFPVNYAGDGARELGVSHEPVARLGAE